MEMFTLKQGEQHSRKTNRAEVGCNSAVAEPGFLDWICEVIKKNNTTIQIVCF
jgi:hypothetical protein